MSFLNTLAKKYRVLATKCQCGGDKCNTGHSTWCPKHHDYKAPINSRNKKPTPLKEFGSYVWVGEDGDLWSAPMLKDGTMDDDEDNSAPVECVDQNFIDAANRLLGTKFTPR